MKRQALGALLALNACLAAAHEGEVEAGEWNFTATLDGKVIGTHRFAAGGTPAARRVDSRAQFTVRLLGIPIYRYRHQADERWAGDCLRELRSETDDDGTRQQVAQRFEGDCLMGFAYWNPRLVHQTRLVDPQTGRVEPIRFDPLPDASIDVGDQPVPARGWRLQTAQQHIRVWYAAGSGRWIGLDADTKSGHQLSYRLTSPRNAP